MSSLKDAGLKTVLGREGQLIDLVPTRVAIVGCGGHCYRNVLPPLRNLPEVEIVAFCDLNERKARAFATNLKPDAAVYTSVETMLDGEQLDAVVVVVGFDDETGEPLYPPVVEAALKRSLYVWMEKPPAASAEGVERMIRAAEHGGGVAQVGFKKVFSPAVRRMKALTRQTSFGNITHYTYSYDVDLPAVVGDLRAPSGRRFLDDIVHVISVIRSIVGTPSAIHVVPGKGGAGAILLRHNDGILGVVTLTDLRSGLAPVERFEVVGEGSNVVLENGAYLSYFPVGNRGPYGTSTDYLPPVTDTEGPDHGPRFWEPEFSLGNLHGGSHFLQGYYEQLATFFRAVRERAPIVDCDLYFARDVMTVVDAARTQAGQWGAVDGKVVPAFPRVTDDIVHLNCDACATRMVMKDGWNYVCRICGATKSAALRRADGGRSV